MKKQYILNELKGLEEEFADVCEFEKRTFNLNTLYMLVTVVVGACFFSLPILFSSAFMFLFTLLRLIVDDKQIGLIKKRIQNEKEHLSDLSNDDHKVDKVGKRKSVLNKLVEKRKKSNRWNKVGGFAAGLVHALSLFSFVATVFNPAFLYLTVVLSLPVFLSACERKLSCGISENLENRINNLRRDLGIDQINAATAKGSNSVKENKEKPDNSKSNDYSNNNSPISNDYTPELPDPNSQEKPRVYTKK